MIELCFGDAVYSELLSVYPPNGDDLHILDIRGLWSDTGEYRCVVTASLSEAAVNRVILCVEQPEEQVVDTVFPLCCYWDERDPHTL